MYSIKVIIAIVNRWLTATVLSTKDIACILLISFGIILFSTAATSFLGVRYTTLISFISTYGLISSVPIILAAFCAIKSKSIYVRHLKCKDYPGPKRENFFTGNYYSMRKRQDKNELFDLFTEWTIEHGKTYVFWRYDDPKWFTADPDIIKCMLTDIALFNKAVNIPNRRLFSQRITGTSSFLTAQGGQLWATKRKRMSTYFTKTHMVCMFDKCKEFIVKRTAEALEGTAAQKKHVDLVEFYGEIYQYLLGALGFDLNCELVSSNAAFHNLCIQRILKWVPLQLQTPIETWKMKRNPEVIETLEMVKKLRQIARHILNYKHKELDEDGQVNEDDIVHLVIKANEDPNVEISVTQEYELDDMMTIFLVIDNMAKTLASFFVEVMRKEDVYKKVAQEVRQADLSSLHSMDKSLSYTEMAILESLRLHPTLMRGIRVLQNDTTLNGLDIAQGTMISFGQLVLHKHPDFWENPTDFMPERFANGSGFIEPFTYLPFVAGPRVCMGKHLAMMSMKLAIVATLKNCDMRPVPGQEKDKEWDLRFTIAGPTKGHIVNFQRV